MGTKATVLAVDNTPLSDGNPENNRQIVILDRSI